MWTKKPNTDYVASFPGHSQLQSLITSSMQVQICAGWCTMLTSNSPAHSGDRRCGIAPSKEAYCQRIWLAAAQGLQGTGHWYQSNSAHPGSAGEWHQVEVREKNSATINVIYWWELWWGFSKGTDTSLHTSRVQRSYMQWRKWSGRRSGRGYVFTSEISIRTY